MALSPYSTLLDLSATSDLDDDDGPRGKPRHGNSIHGYHASNASGDYANLMHLNTEDGVEDFQGFKNGYECSSSRFGSLEKSESEPRLKTTAHRHGSSDSDLDPVRTNSANGIVWGGSESALFKEIESVIKDKEKNKTRPPDTNMGYVHLEFTVNMSPMEQRFGFSVSGGSDEEFPARIDNISKGSPADRAELNVGDEIVEVNGRSLAHCSHAEVIAYIHKCIRSKSICLRVKRKSDKDQVRVSAEEVQNTYIVAVEEDAKRRLEELLYNHKLTPIDMTKNVVAGADTPDTVTSQVELHNTSYSPDSSLEKAVLNTSMPFMAQQNGVLTNGHVEMTSMQGQRDHSDTPRKGKGKGKRSSNAETPLIKSMLPDQYDSQNSLNKSNFNDSFDDSMHGSLDDGQHREMAIDVPKNFQGTAKTPPRFPSNHSSPRSTPFRSSENSKNVKANNHTSSEEQAERIRNYQEEIRKRTEREELREKEEVFLRQSLRRSEKLRKLQHERKAQQKQHSVDGIDNTAFDDDSGGFEEGYVSGRHTQNCREYMKKNLSYDDILESLHNIQSKISSPEGREKVKFLTDLFHHQKFQNAACVHHRVLDAKTRNPPVKSVCLNSQELKRDSVDALCSVNSPHASELTTLLQQPHLKGLLFSHDAVSSREAAAAQDQQPPDDFNLQGLPDAGANIKIVHLEKTTEPLGATVRNEGESVIISRIVKGGTADKSGLLHEGDEILDINGVEMKGKDIDDVSDMLANRVDPAKTYFVGAITSGSSLLKDDANMSGTISFTIYPNSEYTVPSLATGIMHVKALFNYDPEDDPYIPCRELGLSFLKGDILHVIQQQDASWWQAYREGEEDYQTLAGLIPSKAFHEQRESLRLTIGTENKENQKKGRSCSCGRTNKKKKKKYRHSEDVQETLSYQEVAQYYPEPNRRRPIVLIGPPNVGRHELRQRLMESDFDRFAAAVPHTSRSINPAGPDREMDGKDYHFVTRGTFERDIVENKFIEHGEYEKNYYGTSVDSVQQVINNGKICVLNTDPEALYIVQQTDLKPYVIFVCPSNMDKLKQIWQKLNVPNIKDDDLRDIIERSREMEDKYGHFFDYFLVNQDMDKAFDELLAEINRIEVEPQWVPIEWTRARHLLQQQQQGQGHS